MKKLTWLMAVGLSLSTAVWAQEEPKLIVKPSGRILMDATYVHADHQGDDLRSGVGIPDMRVGVGFTYGQWKGKIDMGYAYGKVNMKDVWIQYDFDKQNFVRGGYFIHQYGYQSCTSSSFKETMEEPQSNAVFNNDRMPGVMFEHTDAKTLATLSLVVETDAMKQTTDKTGDEAVGALTRLVYHPHTERGNMFHIGISGGIEGARYSSDPALNHKQFTLASRWPMRVAKVTAQEAVITDAKVMYKFTPEVLYSSGRFAVAAQYFWNRINRSNGLHSFTGTGAYVTLRGLIKGRNYSYTMNDGGLAIPDPGNMELCLQYNYTSLSDASAGIRGGYLNDWALTYNYYPNKYMIWRIRASLTKVTNRSGFDDNNVSILETRFQVKF
ncbi:phosphate-selective porin OprO and OprP [Xylanibacter ruminicola]|uniref:Phosphate-selective porin OprO and OprP n=1 Tax=Xylanibacter ruminicola TaxID=839 RepID=A0A1H4E3I8_XYLRU|nr:porin [Xylanibacter ruminicola]SEA79328.1 phosphate-selective porin OprO and OprP [Xylanibacter ruminicola]